MQYALRPLAVAVASGAATARRTVRAVALCSFLVPISPFLASDASAQTCSGEPDGWRLRACLRAAHAPVALLSAERTRRELATTVGVRVRRDSTLRTDSTFVPADSTWRVEEWWEATETPYLAAIDDTTTAHRPGALPPGWRVHTPEPVDSPRAHIVGRPLPADTLPPPAGAHLDLHAAFLTAAGGTPLPDRRGDVARAALYLRTVYPLHVEAFGDWPASAHARGLRVEALLADHEADPPDDDERQRHGRAAAAQGNTNPFVFSPALVRRAFPLRPRVDREVPPLWINEIHATNAGRDTDEGVEVTGPAQTDLAGWRLVLYGGRGQPYDPYDDAISSMPTLSGALPAEGSLGAAWLPIRGMWNRCNGVALFDPDAALVQFVSYGGCQFNVSTGPVADAAEAVASGGSDPAHPDSLAWTTATRDARGRALQEWTQMPAGFSLQLTGVGASAADFTWGGPHPASPGRLNDYQAPASGANATTGWASGSAVPAPLAATASAQAGEPIHPALTGDALLAALDADFSPARTLSYARVRDSLFTLVAALSPSGDSIRTVYADYALFLPPGSDPTQTGCNGDRDANPRSCNGPRNIQTEHAWPRSRGTDSGDPERDAHHLFPARADVNNDRSNHPFGEVSTSATDRWYRHGTTNTSPPTDLDAWARSDRDGDLFAPRAETRGDIARALFYVRAVYPERVAAARAWFEAQLPTLLAWHDADPADEAEQDRSAGIAAWQGTENPFVLDETLAGRAFAPMPTEGEPEADALALTLGPPRPNPSRGAVSFTLALPRPASIRVVVLDTLGRVVLTVLDGSAPTDSPIQFETAGLSSGTYTVRVTVGADVQTARFTVIR